MCGAVKETLPSESGCQACGVLFVEEGEAQSLVNICPFGRVCGVAWRWHIQDLALFCALAAELGVQDVTG